MFLWQVFPARKVRNNSCNKSPLEGSPYVKGYCNIEMQLAGIFGITIVGVIK